MERDFLSLFGRSGRGREITAQIGFRLFPLLMIGRREEPELRMFGLESGAAFGDAALAQNDDLRALAQRLDDGLPLLEGGRDRFDGK